MTIEKLEMKPLLDELQASEVAYELLPHRHTETAAAEAEALGRYGREVVKTIVLTTPEGFLRAVLPAADRLDLGKVRSLVGTAARLASEEELVGAYPEFELGAVPPIGGPPDPVIADRSLADFEWVVLEAGTHEGSVRLQTADLLAVADCRLAEICQD